MEVYPSDCQRGTFGPCNGYLVYRNGILNFFPDLLYNTWYLVPARGRKKRDKKTRKESGTPHQLAHKHSGNTPCPTRHKRHLHYYCYYYCTAATHTSCAAVVVLALSVRLDTRHRQVRTRKNSTWVMMLTV